KHFMNSTDSPPYLFGRRDYDIRHHTEGYRARTRSLRARLRTERLTRGGRHEHSPDGHLRTRIVDCVKLDPTPSHASACAFPWVRCVPGTNFGYFETRDNRSLL